MVRRAVAFGVLAWLLPGCAHNSDWLIRQPAVESTIGNDPTKAPAGKVIAPPGLGVDLGDRSWDVSGDAGLASSTPTLTTPLESAPPGLIRVDIEETVGFLPLTCPKDLRVVTG